MQSAIAIIYLQPIYIKWKIDCTTISNWERDKERKKEEMESFFKCIKECINECINGCINEFK